MEEDKKNPGQLVFGLDIGTRSLVGTVGYMTGDKFHVVAQCVREHDTRSMLDGQIHDINTVGRSIKEVKEKLENQIGKQLNEVCIAAAGRVLKTVTVSAELEFPEEKAEGLRYWHAWALVKGRHFDKARPLLAEPFADPVYAPLALRLAARLELEAGARDAAEEMFKRAAAAFGTNATDRAENAVEWANARLSFGDLAGARAVLADEKAAEAPGEAGDAARLLTADLAARAGDANMARRVRLQLVDGGTNTAERAYVLAACGLADDFWNAGETNRAIDVLRAARGEHRQRQNGRDEDGKYSFHFGSFFLVVCAIIPHLDEKINGRVSIVTLMRKKQGYC